MRPDTRAALLERARRLAKLQRGKRYVPRCFTAAVQGTGDPPTGPLVYVLRHGEWVRQQGEDHA